MNALSWVKKKQTKNTTRTVGYVIKIHKLILGKRL